LRRRQVIWFLLSFVFIWLANFLFSSAPVTAVQTVNDALMASGRLPAMTSSLPKLFPLLLKEWRSKDLHSFRHFKFPPRPASLAATARQGAAARPLQCHGGSRVPPPAQRKDPPLFLSMNVVIGNFFQIRREGDARHNQPPWSGNAQLMAAIRIGMGRR
jgi:hypothetical protein